MNSLNNCEELYQRFLSHARNCDVTSVATIINSMAGNSTAALPLRDRLLVEMNKCNSDLLPIIKSIGWAAMINEIFRDDCVVSALENVIIHVIGQSKTSTENNNKYTNAIFIETLLSLGLLGTTKAKEVIQRVQMSNPGTSIYEFCKTIKSLE